MTDDTDMGEGNVQANASQTLNDPTGGTEPQQVETVTTTVDVGATALGVDDLVLLSGADSREMRAPIPNENDMTQDEEDLNKILGLHDPPLNFHEAPSRPNPGTHRRHAPQAIPNASISEAQSTAVENNEQGSSSVEDTMMPSASQVGQLTEPGTKPLLRFEDKSIATHEDDFADTNTTMKTLEDIVQSDDYKSQRSKLMFNYKKLLEFMKPPAGESEPVGESTSQQLMATWAMCSRTAKQAPHEESMKVIQDLIDLGKGYGPLPQCFQGRNFATPMWIVSMDFFKKNLLPTALMSISVNHLMRESILSKDGSLDAEGLVLSDDDCKPGGGC